MLQGVSATQFSKAAGSNHSACTSSASTWAGLALMAKQVPCCLRGAHQAVALVGEHFRRDVTRRVVRDRQCMCRGRTAAYCQAAAEAHAHQAVALVGEHFRRYVWRRAAGRVSYPASILVYTLGQVEVQHLRATDLVLHFASLLFAFRALWLKWAAYRPQRTAACCLYASWLARLNLYCECQHTSSA